LNVAVPFLNQSISQLAAKTLFIFLYIILRTHFMHIYIYIYINNF